VHAEHAAMTRRQQFGPYEVRVWPGEARAELRRAGTLFHLMHGRAHAQALVAFWDSQQRAGAEGRDAVNILAALGFVLAALPVEAPR